MKPETNISKLAIINIDEVNKVTLEYMQQKKEIRDLCEFFGYLPYTKKNIKHGTQTRNI